MPRFSLAVFAFALLSTFARPAAAQTPAALARAETPSEKRARLSLDSVRHSPLELRNLLVKMPKGSDLHTHLYGAVNAETWINNAAEDQMCIDPAAIRGIGAVFSSGEGQPLSCPAGKIPASEVWKNQHLFDDLVDAFS